MREVDGPRPRRDRCIWPLGRRAVAQSLQKALRFIPRALHAHQVRAPGHLSLFSARGAGMLVAEVRVAMLSTGPKACKR